MRTLRYLLLLGAMLVAPAIGEGVARGIYFPAGTYDYWGYVPWSTFGTVNEACSRGLELMRREEYAKAKKQFAARHKESPTDLIAICGLAQCSMWLNDLPGYMDSIAKECAAPMSHGGKPARNLLLAYQYGMALIASERREGRKIKFVLGQKDRPGTYYYSWFMGDKAAFDPTSKESAVLSISIQYASGEFVEARRRSLVVLEKSPRFYQVRLMLAQTYGVGVVSYSDGHSPPTPAPPEEREDDVRAFKEAMQVVKEQPDFLPAYYVAGRFATVVDKAAARKLLSHYVALSKSDDPRRASAQKMLARL